MAVPKPLLNPALNRSTMDSTTNVYPRLTGIVTPSSSTIKALNDIKYGRAEPRPLRELYSEDTKELIELQQQNNFPYISDGQRLWGDLLRPVYEGMENVGVGSQTRWFETNGFCFPPRIAGKPRAGKADWGKYIYTDLLPAQRQITLPGLYTLLRMAENAAEVGEKPLLEAFSEQLALIIQSLPPGKTLIEFSEPALAYDSMTQFPRQREVLTLAKLAYQHLLQQQQRTTTTTTTTTITTTTTTITTLLQLPGGNFYDYPELLDLPVNGFGIDLTETIPNDRINLEGKILSADMVNAWESYPEDLNFDAERVRNAIKLWQPSEVYITSNAQLYHTISYQYARNKILDIISLTKCLTERLRD